MRWVAGVGYIYKIYNQINSKVYIGQTNRDVETRWKEHLRHATDYQRYRSDNHLYRSMVKYGVDAFVIETIEKCDDSELNSRETYWIKYYNSFDENCGYNLTLGGDGTSSIDHDEVYRLWDQGMSSGEIARTMHVAQSNVVGILHGYEKYSIDEGFSRGYDHVRRTKGRPVRQYTTSGEFVAQYYSSKDAARRVPHSSRQNIKRCCDSLKGLSGGYQWRYADDAPPEPYTPPQHPQSKAIAQRNADGVLINVYDSIAHASRSLSISPRKVRSLCNGNLVEDVDYTLAYAA